MGLMSSTYIWLHGVEYLGVNAADELKVIQVQAGT